MKRFCWLGGLMDVFLDEMMIPIRMDRVSQLEHKHTIIFFIYLFSYVPILNCVLLFIWKKESQRIDNDGIKTNQWRCWCKTGSEWTREKATGPLLSHHLLSSFFVEGRRCPGWCIHIAREKERDFDAPMDTEKSIGAGYPPSSPPLGIHIKTADIFDRQMECRCCFTKGKVGRLKRSQGKKSWYASSDSQRKKRKKKKREREKTRTKFFLCIQIWTLFSFLCGINTRDGAGTHVTNSCQKCQTLISKAGWAGFSSFFLSFFFFFFFARRRDYSGMCVWLFRRVPSLFLPFHLLR